MNQRMNWRILLWKNRTWKWTKNCPEKFPLKNCCENLTTVSITNTRTISRLSNKKVHLPAEPFLSKFKLVLNAFLWTGILKDILEVPEPDSLLLPERKRMRVEYEQDKFDPEHYMSVTKLLA
jgi:hypothetical protein